MSRLAIVESREGAAKILRDDPNARLVSDNPILSHGAPIDNIDALVDQDLTNRLGLWAVEVADRLDGVVGPLVDVNRTAGDRVLSTSRPIRVLVASLIYRSVVLARGIETYQPEMVDFVVTNVWGDCANPGLDPGRFASPFPILAEAGFLGDCPFGVDHIDIDRSEGVNDTSSTSTLARVALLPRDVVVSLVSNRLRRRFDARGKARTIPIIGDSEILREAVPQLRRAGFEPRFYKSVTKAIRVAPVAGVDVTEVASRVASVLEREMHVLADVLNDAQRRAIGTVLASALTKGAPWMAGAIVAGAEFADRVYEACNRPAGVLTSAMSQLACAGFHRQANKLGMRVFVAEHGISKGVAALASSTVSGSEINNCDTFLAISKRATRDIPTGAQTHTEGYVVVGSPEHVRRLQNARLQRRLARRRLGLGAKETAIFHVSPFPFYGNQRPGHLVASESTAFDIELKFWERVYAGCNKRVWFKSYPTERLAFHPPLATVFEDRANISSLGNEDFRYVRAAADVIVTGTPTSTLGWCLGTDVPVVWWHSRKISPLVSDLVDQFEKSLLFVDIDQAGWEDELARLLLRPLSEIQDLWDEKRPARDQLTKDAIFGPDGGPGGAVAQAVASAWRANEASAEITV